MENFRMQDVAALVAAGSPYQVRVAMDEDTIERYAAMYREKGVRALPMLTTCGDVVIDGHHRLEAARRAGLTEVATYRVLVEDGVLSNGNLFLAALRKNASHGLSLSRADRTRAARILLEHFPTKTLREVAAEVGLSKSTIGTLKKERESVSKMVNPEPEAAPDAEAEAGAEADADALPTAAGNLEVQCDMCGMKAEEVDMADPDCGWVQVDEKVFCSPLCRSAFERRAQEEADEVADDEADESDLLLEPEEAATGEPSPAFHRPCPFCGADGQLGSWGIYLNTPTSYEISCPNPNCPVTFSSTPERTVEAAWAVWDTRVESPSTPLPHPLLDLITRLQAGISRPGVRLRLYDHDGSHFLKLFISSEENGVERVCIID